MQYSYQQKQQIVADLTALIGSPTTGGVGLMSVVPITGVKELIRITYPNGLPAVVVPTPTAKESKKADSQHNDRVNVFELFLVIDITANNNDYMVEELTDMVLNAFDTDQTLGGTSWPTVDAATSASIPVEDGDKQYLIVPITLKCHTLIDIPFDLESGADNAQAG